MSLFRNQPAWQLYPLSTGAGDSATWSSSGVVTFNLKNIPILVGALAYYLMGIFVTFTGNVDQPASGGSLLSRDQLIRSLIDTLELRNCWHGTPLSSRNVRGSMLPIIEHLGLGYSDPQIHFARMASSDGDKDFRITVFIPTCVGVGDKPHYTAQLALFYKQAQLDLNLAASTVLDGLSTGAVFENVTIRAQACLLPEPEIRLGMASEWVDYQSTASSGQEQIELDSFGNKTGLSRVQPGGGMMFLGALTSAGGLPGAFAGETVTRFSFPWLGQVDTRQIDPFVAMALLAGANPSAAFIDTSSNGTGHRTGYPYADTALIQPGGTAPGLANLLFFPLLAPPSNFEVTKMKTAKGTQAYFLSATFAGSTNHTLAWQAKSFDDAGRQDAVKEIVDSGLARAVIGQSSDLGWVAKLTKKNQEIDPDKLRYMPFRLVKNTPKKVVSPVAAAARAFGRMG